MTAPWVAVVVCLWVVVISLALIVAGVLRKVATTLESLHSRAAPGEHMVVGPPPGSALPPVLLSKSDGAQVSLADLAGPFVLAILTSHCSPCVAIADRLRAERPTLASLNGLVVLTDPEGPERLSLGYPLEVLVDRHSRALSDLQVPGTPFAIAINAEGTVQSAQFLAGVDQLANLLDAVRPSRARIP
ncbi:MAG: peroxiredoxin family protein [Acidimicrobiales bacterium]